MMTLDEFEKRFCSLCGSQRCNGVDDEEHREGCEYYRLVYPYGENTTICGEDGCDGCLLQHANRIDLCKQKGTEKLGLLPSSLWPFLLSEQE